MNHPYLSQQELVSFVPLLSWIRAAVRCGFAIAPVLDEIGVPVTDSGAHGIVITQEQSFRLIETCVARASGEHFPFILGENAALESIPEVQAYICSCVTLREAVKYYNWVGQVMGNGVELSLHETDGYSRIQLSMGNPAYRAASVFFTETVITSIVRLISQLLGRKEVEQLTFRHAPPAYAAAYAGFFGLPVRFGQDADAVTIRTALLDLKLNGALPELQQKARSQLLQRLSTLSAAGSMAGQLNRLFADHPDLLTCGLDSAAARLDMQPRTLQRRLHEEDKTFSDVQAQSRFEMSCTLLRNTNYSVDEISELLGFSDRRALTRAFKRWANTSPSHYRNSVTPAI
ncbi:AraC family transcriptional regulator ligand-binding domain-containing protein [Duganella sp. BuS-21]|uniref:AraC family transcriptional regulator n=1 Tax=Duganella sp. BuS-21 TaxID=2943848 RepID=UPI0035A67056